MLPVDRGIATEETAGLTGQATWITGGRRVSRVVRWAEHLPGSYWLLGAAAAALLLALRALALWLTPLERQVDFNWFRTLSMPLLSGYLVASVNAGVQAARRSLRELAPLLPGGEEEARELSVHVAAPQRLGLRLALAFGILVPLALGLVLSDRATGVLAGNPIDLYFAGAALVFWTLFALNAVYVITTGATLGRLARERVRVDLFHLEQLRPFGGFGLRQALLVVGALALAFLLLATPGAGEAWLLRARLVSAVPLIVPSFAVTACFAVGAFVHPMWAIRRRIQREKEMALERLGARIGPHWEETGDPARDAHVSDVLVLRSQISDLPEWPVDGWMKRRFGIYLMIPLLSLTLKALFEGFVGRLLG